jgi:hypothetical protein
MPMQHRLFLLLVVSVLLLVVAVIVWSSPAVTCIIARSSPCGAATAVPTSWTGTFSTSNCTLGGGACPLPTLATSYGTYQLTFASGVPMPSNGEIITVYGAPVVGEQNAGCPVSPPYQPNCLLGTFNVVSWQPA